MQHNARPIEFILIAARRILITYHGYRKPETVLRGKAHPGYIHGERSLEGIKRHQEVMGRIKMLTKLAKQLGMIK